MKTNLHIAVGMIASLFALPAMAQENINITIVSGNAPQFAAVNAVTNGFIPEVDRILAETGNYKINWNEAYSGQIAKARGELEAVASGLGDMGVVISAYTPDKLPLNTIKFSTPFSEQDPNVGVDSINYMFENFEAYRQEYEEFNQHVLRNTAVVNSFTIFSSVPINSVGDMAGLKIAGVGINLPWITAAGAAGVTGEMPTAYNSLQTGVYDGFILWQHIGAALKICEVAPYAANMTGSGGDAGVMLTVNMDIWNELPAEVQEAFEAGSEVWNKTNLEILAQGAKTGRETCESQYGQTTVDFTTEEMKAWAEAMPPLGKQWAERAEARGLPGHEMLAAYLDYMRDNGQTVLRDWDRE